MIQRIQTIHLLIAAALVAVAACCPLAFFGSESGQFDLYAFGLRAADGTTVQSTIYLGILTIAALALPLLTIALYKRRMLQIRLCAVEMVLLLGCTAMTGIYYFLSYRFFSDFGFMAQSIRIPIVLTPAAIIPTFLAARNILKDELLVRSLDRIR